MSSPKATPPDTTVTSALISVIVPMKNESASITALLEQLTVVFDTMASYKVEYIFVDDGSTDDSAAVVQKLARKNPSVQLLRLTRNFGKEIATTAGLHASRGEAAIIIDADLQHPPALIPAFMQQWQDGYDVVIGRQQLSSVYASLPKRLTARWYYRIINAISSIEVTPHATDFRLLDRSVIDEFNRFTERNRMTRGLIDWLGFSRTYIDFVPNKRLHGERSYSYRSLLTLATNSIVSLSIFPLKIAGYLGGLITVVSIPLILFILGNKWFGHNSYNFSGSAILAAMLLFLIGIVLICIGLIALYIANIHGEVLNRPLYVIKRDTRRPR